jgi:hypothetical protein
MMEHSNHPSDIPFSLDVMASPSARGLVEKQMMVSPGGLDARIGSAKNATE